MSKSKRLKKIRKEQNKLIESGLYSDGKVKHAKKIVGINLDGTLKTASPETVHSARRLAKRDAKKFL